MARMSSLLSTLQQDGAFLAASWSAATRAAAQSGAALAGMARAATSRASLLRATAAAGAAIASTAVSCAALDAFHADPDRPCPPTAGSTPAVDDGLLALLRGRSLRSIDDVASLMLRMDAALPAGDGLKAFNTLYRMVTEHIRDARDWEDRPWILELDVRFAELYFDGLESCLAAPHAAPEAWRTLVERRFRPDVAPVQFALAGMSAHIVRDLPVAVVRTWEAMETADHGRDTATFRDYRRVNDVLDAVEPGAMSVLATGLFKLLDDALEPADAWAAMAVIHAARDLAWTHAENLSTAGLGSDEARLYVAALDTVAADTGRAALV